MEGSTDYDRYALDRRQACSHRSGAHRSTVGAGLTRDGASSASTLGVAWITSFACLIDCCTVVSILARLHQPSTNH
ncbi:hypothetical protein D3C80_1730590 [compost metagenome]